MPKLTQRVERLETTVAALEQRMGGIAARLDQQPRIRYLNGSWPLRDGDKYPQDHRKSASPYESWWRRSPPATE